VRLEEQVLAAHLDGPARGDHVGLHAELAAGPLEDVAEGFHPALAPVLGVHDLAVAEEDQSQVLRVLDAEAAGEAVAGVELDQIHQAQAGHPSVEAVGGGAPGFLRPPHGRLPGFEPRASRARSVLLRSADGST